MTFKDFSADYANGVTALAALGALALAALTLWYLRREFSAKYRPYVVPIVHVELEQGQLRCHVAIEPRNVGPHPCNAMLTGIELRVGDERYSTPDQTTWTLLAPETLSVLFPAGRLNEEGIKKIREGRYRQNRAEITFVLHTTSIEGKFTERKRCDYEINVLTDVPQVLARADSVKPA